MSERKKRKTTPEEPNMAVLASLANGLQLNPLPPPAPEELDPAVPHAPKRIPHLDASEFKLAVENALRYFPAELHETLAPEFAKELATYGHIYMYRFRPTAYEMKAYPLPMYPARSKQTASIMMMIMNNLDYRVAQFPHELVTYGGNGSVFQNWAQYHLVMKYLSEMTEEQTLVMYSGHPMGVFPSHKDAPRCVIANGNMIPNYSTRPMYDKLYAMGNTMYGQMTAGSYCYIGPQGIVHGTTITVMNAARKYLNNVDLSGKVFVTAGLGGMSGAQPKAGVICGAITVVAEVDPKALYKRKDQGWLMESFESLDELMARIKVARAEKKSVSLGYLGNVVSLWERLAEEPELLAELGSDQTSCHNVFGGGYVPVQLSFEESKRCMVEEPEKFKELVQESLRRQIAAINKLTVRGMRFWDYGNSFLLECSRAGADVMAENGKDFRYPSYVQDIIGDIFSLGFGPFRWVCTSGDPEDLKLTDQLAAKVIRDLLTDAPEQLKQQYEDNLKWIEQADENHLVVGSQARILYVDTQGRLELALAFNQAVRRKQLKGPVVLSRDHHDVSGTDSPYRETSNVTDGSKWTADMAIQNVVGDACRGATWVALHNGGGVGWGEVVNGGFGLVMDGTHEAERRAIMMVPWDVNNGVARRAWGRNANAEFNIRRQMEFEPRLRVTMPNHADGALLDKVVASFMTN